MSSVSNTYSTLRVQSQVHIILDIPIFLLWVVQNKTSLVCLKDPWKDLPMSSLAKPGVYYSLSSQFSFIFQPFTPYIFYVSFLVSQTFCNLLLFYAVCIFIAFLVALRFLSLFKSRKRLSGTLIKYYTKHT